MLGLGLSAGKSAAPQGVEPLESQVLYDRDGTSTPFTVTDTLAYTSSLSGGSFNNSADSFAGGSSFMKFVVSTADPDPYFYIPQNLLSEPLSTFYNRRGEGGYLKISITHGFPSTNTDTGTSQRIRIFAGTINQAQAGQAKDILVTRALTRRWNDLADPDGDADYLKVEFEDPDAGEPAVGDVMYVQKIKVEYIAA